MEQEVAQRVIPPDEFRYRVLLARLHAGLTTRQAADRCGTNSASWSNWERGMKPRDLLDVVERISEGLGIDRDWLLFGGPLAKEERPGRVLSRSKTGEARQPNVFYPGMTDRTSPTPASQGSVRLTRGVNHSPVSPTPSRPPQHSPSRQMRGTARRNRPNS